MLVDFVCSDAKNLEDYDSKDWTGEHNREGGRPREGGREGVLEHGRMFLLHPYSQMNTLLMLFPKLVSLD